ncbi:EamA family transporter RarD [Guptibacillus hwajinpoensis]|uniref:Chloramphenicol-sensitive protein RarD n=1 Tax=Guptibacillus hwajinpoensis TaxID=208199 RepID=A0ABU0K722_9BACL|nr:EamA family transporter RarD [Alkalihalobacillus hemicentroti]MDQ0484133.1 chloramphenicol-sensitive protein RarD [Alkalihalobacillus hemicentroti]
MKAGIDQDQTIGIVSGAGAYFLWGILPLYWKLVATVPSEEVLAHRIIWSFVFMIVILLVLGKLSSFQKELISILRKPKKLTAIIFASLFITINWYAFIWAVNHDHVIQTSLGYYINPLISVLLGILFLKERLSFWQMISFGLATVGVLNLVFRFGEIPWVSLVLALSFGIYGLLKKKAKLGALTGLTIETLFITPFALIYLMSVRTSIGDALYVENTMILTLLLGAGIITAVPLLLFATGANRISLSMIGFLQYIAPTLMLIQGVFLYEETFTSAHFISFVLIWVALLIFTLSRTRLFRRMEPRVFQEKHSLS